VSKTDLGNLSCNQAADTSKPRNYHLWFSFDVETTNEKARNLFEKIALRQWLLAAMPGGTLKS